MRGLWPERSAAIDPVWRLSWPPIEPATFAMCPRHQALQEVSNTLAARLGQEGWLSLFAGPESVAETHFASADERQWQIIETLVGLHHQDGRVFTEGRGDEPTPLALLFDQVDPDGRAQAGRRIAERAIESIQSAANGAIRLSVAAKARLQTRTAANLHAGRVERALRAGRWERLAPDRIVRELGGLSGRRWGIQAGEIAEQGGVVELDVSEATIVRILRDAFGRSVLNGDDLIEGEGRPAENPEILG